MLSPVPLYTCVASVMLAVVVAGLPWAHGAAVSVCVGAATALLNTPCMHMYAFCDDMSTHICLHTYADACVCAHTHMHAKVHTHTYTYICLRVSIVVLFISHM